MVDVIDPVAVDALIAAFGADLPPLAGIVHAAGIADGCLLADHRPETFLDVLAPKVRGTQNLARRDRSPSISTSSSSSRR